MAKASWSLHGGRTGYGLALLWECMIYNAVSRLVATTTAMTLAKGVATDALYLNAWWRGSPAVAIAVAEATTSDSALAKTMGDARWQQTFQVNPSLLEVCALLQNQCKFTWGLLPPKWRLSFFAQTLGSHIWIVTIESFLFHLESVNGNRNQWHHLTFLTMQGWDISDVYLNIDLPGER